MPVLKTTSPAQVVSAPKDFPSILVPSLSTRVAVFSFGIGSIVGGGWRDGKTDFTVGKSWFKLCPV